MNQKRRKRLRAAIQQLDEVVSIIDDVTWDEESSLDNLPANLGESQMADNMSDAIDDMADASEVLKNAINEAITILGDVVNR